MNKQTNKKNGKTHFTNTHTHTHTKLKPNTTLSNSKHHTLQNESTKQSFNCHLVEWIESYSSHFWLCIAEDQNSVAIERLQSQHTRFLYVDCDPFENCCIFSSFHVFMLYKEITLLLVFVVVLIRCSNTKTAYAIGTFPQNAVQTHYVPGTLYQTILKIRHHIQTFKLIHICRESKRSAGQCLVYIEMHSS